MLLAKTVAHVQVEGMPRFMEVDSIMGGLPRVEVLDLRGWKTYLGFMVA